MISLQLLNYVPLCLAPPPRPHHKVIILSKSFSEPIFFLSLGLHDINSTPFGSVP